MAGRERGHGGASADEVPAVSTTRDLLAFLAIPVALIVLAVVITVMGSPEKKLASCGAGWNDPNDLSKCVMADFPELRP